MITLRMIAIAAALLLGTPIVVAAFHDLPDVDGGEIVNKNLEAAAWVVDVTLADLPPRDEGGTAEMRDEQLVEGHTVFLTLDIFVRLNATNGTVNVTGYVECRHEVSYTGPGVGTPVGTVFIPGHIDRAGAECRAGERVFVTPDPFFDQTVTNSGLSPTGITLPFTTPSGAQGFVEEFAFTSTTHNQWGDADTRTLYAYATPVFSPWVHSDGRPKSFLAGIPTDRLDEMSIKDFTIILQDDPRLRLA